MDARRKNNVQVRGAGERTVVFAHGFGCDLTAWSDVAPGFEAGNRVVLFDHAGCGHADPAAYDFATYATLDAYAADVVAVGEALDLAGAVFVGHSVGAMIGMLAARRAPALFSRMVMLCPSPCYVDDGDYVGGFSRSDIDDLLEVLDANFLGWSRAAAPAIMGNGDRPELAAALGDSFCRTDPDIAKAFARVTFLSDHRAEVAEHVLPTLILQTQSDMVAPVAVGRYLATHMRRGELVLMQATGHCPHMSAPQETTAAIERFLAA